jgi:DNA polymerase-1
MALKEYMISEHGALRFPPLEGDDLLGISTDGVADVIVSYDKDLRQIAGAHYNPLTHHWSQVTQAEADHWHLMQTLTGDPTDGFKGVPGIGSAKATKVLEGLTEEDAWTAVVNCYKAHSLTEEDALLQARVARVLRRNEFNASTYQVKYWRS